MNSINGKNFYCRVIEERILTRWQDGMKQDSKLSVRDKVAVSIDGTKTYRLWNTDLVRCSPSGDVYINVTGNSDMEDNYYRWYRRPEEVIMTRTTKNRLNAFLHYYGFDSLKVRSRKKDWSIKYNGEKLEVDNWYKLDLENNRLLKVTDC